MCLCILWPLQFNFGPVSSSKFQFSNYSPALSLNCQSYYILDNTTALGVKEEVGEAPLQVLQSHLAEPKSYSLLTLQKAATLTAAVT